MKCLAASLTIVALLFPIALPAARAGSLDDLDEQLGKAWTALAAKGLPKDRKVNVAVLPFADDLDGVRRLGTLAAEKLETKVVQHPNVRLTERENLEALQREQDTWIHDLFEERDPRKSATMAKLLKADFLVLGRMIPAGGEIHYSLKLLESASGQVKAMQGFRIRNDASVPPLLWYVQEPKKRPTLPLDFAPIELSFSVMAQKRQADASVWEGKLEDGGEMKSRDQFQVHFAPVANCHVYVLLFDSKGRASTLFPYEGVKLGNKCKGDVRYVVPTPGQGRRAAGSISTTTPVPRLSTSWPVTSR